MTATSSATPSAPEAVQTALDQSWWGQIVGLAAYCGMSWAGVLDYPRLNSLLGAVFLACYLGSLVNLIVAAERHPEVLGQ